LPEARGPGGYRRLESLEGARGERGLPRLERGEGFAQAREGRGVCQRLERGEEAGEGE
jgi:hypothetical protein